MQTATVHPAFGTQTELFQMSRLEEVPAHDWARHSLRILDIIDNQVRRLRKRQLIEAYLRGDHTGCYWGIRTNYSDYRLIDDPLKCTTRDPTYRRRFRHACKPWTATIFAPSAACRGGRIDHRVPFR
jgi:hypothetical protein